MSLYDAIAESETGISKAKDGGISAAFCFSETLALFAGHFPERPILPGILQFEMVKYAAEKTYGCGFKIKSIAKSKFSAQLYPEEDISLVMTVKQENGLYQVKATLKREDKIAGKLNVILAEA